MAGCGNEGLNKLQFDYYITFSATTPTTVLKVRAYYYTYVQGNDGVEDIMTREFKDTVLTVYNSEVQHYKDYFTQQFQTEFNNRNR